MKNIPLPVIIVAVLFILVGCVGFIYHVKEFFQPGHNWIEVIWVLILRVSAIVAGIYLLKRKNWARWFVIVWLAYHVLISMYNSIEQVITHAVFLVIVSVLLFLPVSSRYFQQSKSVS